MRLDRQHFRIHFLWALPSLCLVVGLMVWYSLSSVRAGYWLGGGSLPGLVCGVIAGSIILFEMLLWPRKALRGWRLIATKQWMAAHLWFGLASWPIAVLHSGFHLGGTLPATFMVLFSLTILSGLYGWFVQNIIPKLLLKRVSAETITSQIGFVSARNVSDARALLTSALGPPPGEANVGDMLEYEYRANRKASVVVGATRDVGRVRGRTLRTAAIQSSPKDAEIIWNAYTQLQGYMQHGKRNRSPFSKAEHANKFFADLKEQCNPSCAPLVAALEEYCDQRRQFDIQLWLHGWLHYWLPVHIGLSVAVTVLLVFHVVTAMRYW